MTAKAQIEIELLKKELNIQQKKLGNRNIDTARARYYLGRALGLSNKIHETIMMCKMFINNRKSQNPPSL